MSGKGSKPRPFSVPLSTYGDNWDAAFGKKGMGSRTKTAEHVYRVRDGSGALWLNKAEKDRIMDQVFKPIEE